MKFKDMGINSRPEGSIYEVSFGDHSDLYGYTTLMSDIIKLSEIRGEGQLFKHTED